MKLLCMIGIHRIEPTKIFYSKVVIDMKREEETFVKWADSWTGYCCAHCSKRKIKKIGISAPGITQQAYDWLHEKPIKGEVIRLVKNK